VSDRSGLGQMGSVASALRIAAAIVAVEYLARHVAAFAVPTLAEPRVNETLAGGVALVALSLVTARVVGARGLGHALVGVLASARRWEAWAGGVSALAAGFGVGLVDRVLWGNVVLRSFSLPLQDTTLLVSASRWLVPASLVVVNGLIVPLAEEWLWRGLVQPRIVRTYGGPAGIAITAAACSLEHAIVDASLQRLLAIGISGAVFGVVARRASWKASALAHVVASSVVAALAVASILAQPSCLSAEPMLSPELVTARARALDLIDARDPEQLESLFTPGFLDAVGMDEAMRVYGRVHDAHGHCTWKCATRVDGASRVDGQLSCSRSPAYMEIGVESDPPYKVDYLVIVPFAQELPH
jgi:uncharacterized protein